MKIPFGLNETYYDESGREVRIISHNGMREGYPIIGEIRFSDSEYLLGYYSALGYCLSFDKDNDLTLRKKLDDSEELVNWLKSGRLV